jgi:hypothetical protein
MTAASILRAPPQYKRDVLSQAIDGRFQHNVFWFELFTGFCALYSFRINLKIQKNFLRITASNLKTPQDND